MDLNGIFLIDKPVGWTSFDIVAKTRNILQKEIFEQTGQKQKVKVGHSGTLDPLASGLMIILVGSYCKRAGEFSKLDKTYEVTMKLGTSSTTGDEEGDKTNVQCPMFNVKEIEEALSAFLGESMQVPPAFSAIKIDGKRAYKLARQGKEVKIEPRKINISDIKLDKYDFPLVNFTVSVSSGTYVRSLVEDIAKKLGTLGYMTGLKRTIVGHFDLRNALKLENLTYHMLQK